MDKLGLGSDKLILDTERLFISGQSMGGWTSIASCAGNQNIFSVSLSHDAAFYQNAQDIRDDTIELYVPTYML